MYDSSSTVGALLKQEVVPKGQLISEGNCGVFKSPKSEPFFVRISALASKMGQNNKI